MGVRSSGLGIAWRGAGRRRSALRVPGLSEVPALLVHALVAATPRWAPDLVACARTWRQVCSRASRAFHAVQGSLVCALSPHYICPLVPAVLGGMWHVSAHKAALFSHRALLHISFGLSGNFLGIGAG